MNFDDMLGELGEMGRFQITTYSLICVAVLFSGANSLSYAFIAGTTNYRCYVPACDASKGGSKFEQPWLRFAIPKGDPDTGQPYKNCLRYIYQGNDTKCNAESFSNKTEACTSFVFDENEDTVIDDFEITCDENQWKQTLIGNAHFLGILCGSFTFGLLSDKYGRKYIYLSSLILCSLTGIGHILADAYCIFLIVVLVHAASLAGIYPLSFVIGIELVGRKKREMTALILNFFYSFGEAILGIVAWKFKYKWQLVQLLVAGPCILFIFYFCFIPESVRWLIAQKKYEAVKEIVFQAARINKVTLSQELQDSLNQPSDKNEEDEKSVQIWPTVKQVVKSKILVVRIAIICYLWATVAFIFYGLSLNATTISGNKYLNFILVSLVEIPGYCIAWIALVKLGRKKSLICALFICGITCIILAFLRGIMWLIVCIFLIGKLSITVAFAILYVYSSELFPTIIRSGGIAVASTIGRIGAFMAPCIPLIDVYSTGVCIISMTLFSAIAFVGGGLSFKLPETLNKFLPETVEDAANI